MSGGWTVVDYNSNKSLPITGIASSGTVAPFVTPALGSQDPVGKFRVSTPQALIDTDFEYGTQPTKWETIALQNNRQSVYFIQQQPIGVNSITGTTTLTLTGAFVVAANTPIFIQNATDPNANGWWYTAAGGTNSMTVIPTTACAAGEKYSATSTYTYVGYFYSNCGIEVGANAFTTDGTSNVTVATSNAHGLQAGSYVYIRGTTSSGTIINGAQIVTIVATSNAFRFTNTNGSVAAAAITNSAGTNVVYARPSGYTEPRSFDGGVAFTAGGGTPNQQLIRQTRRYFRYQSGKGIQFSTGSSLKPALFVTSLTGSTTTATVTTRYAHNLTVGANIQVVNADQGVYNGNFTVVTVTSPNVFTYTTVNSVGAATTATGIIRISPTSWYGSSNRVGMFDQQNGVFFEFDGQKLYAVLRNSINQINGTVAVTNGSATVTGTGTAFATQLAPGDYIVIRGQSYKVVIITSNTDLKISPEYRGSTISGALVSKTIDVRVPQSQWYDKCDGTGASGYNIDLTRMQMFYIDYSWYGAGVVRYGFRATNGQVTYVTQIQNNNRQFEAYMRSGNMAAHYESNGQSPITFLTATLQSSGTTTTTAAITTSSLSIPLTSVANFNAAGVVLIGSEYISYSGVSGTTLVGCVRGYGGTTARGYPSGTTVTASSMDIADGTGFAPSGTVKVQAASVTGAIEYIRYAGNDGSFLYGLTRAQTGGQAAATTFTFSATAPTAVEFASPDTVPSLSHWGSSVIMDGQFNDDKSLIFNYGTNAQLTLATSTTQVTPILAIRIAPSVDNGQVGLLGAKEIINRMQLQLVELGVVTSGPVLINLILNGYVSGGTWGNWAPPLALGSGAYSSSLAQVAVNTGPTGTLVGGESVAAAYTNTNGQTTLDLSFVRDLGNSILGGGTSSSVPTAQSNVYPDGPDILYVCATNVVTAATPTILARLSWKEAQA
jgi:hypothetical protein